MSTEILKNKFNVVIGKTVDTGTRINVYDSSNALLGYYSKSNDRTYDASNNYKGQGNLLAIFLADKY